jgi:regulator of replication initiation timing
MEQEATHIEMLEERIDSLAVANEELRERLDKASTELISIIERTQYREQRNRDLTAQADRLRIHLQQGIEL